MEFEDDARACLQFYRESKHIQDGQHIDANIDEKVRRTMHGRGTPPPVSPRFFVLADRFVRWAGRRRSCVFSGFAPPQAASTHAILLHVACGIVTLICAAAQFDVTLRRARPRVHRWTGRLYVIAGLGMVGSLRPLRATVGMGRGTTPDHAMQARRRALCSKCLPSG